MIDKESVIRELREREDAMSKITDYREAKRNRKRIGELRQLYWKCKGGEE